MPQSITKILQEATKRLSASGADSPRLDAELLLTAAMRVDRTRVIIDGDKPVGDQARERFEELLERRLHHEPIAYILGHKEFRGREFLVNSHVLIPRPETEMLVEIALDWLNRKSRNAQRRARNPKAEAPKSKSKTRKIEQGTQDAELRILDLGTGSGAIGLTLAAEMPGARVVCSDLSAEALAVARENAKQLGLAVGGRIEFIQSDIFSTLAGAFDLIVSNPPYVGENEREILMPDVRDYEPALALFSGPEGDEFIRRMLAEAPDRLLAGGVLVFEIGYAQGEKALKLTQADARWKPPTIHRDGGGHPRVVVIQQV